MKVVFTKNALEDYSYWEKNNKKIASRIKQLLKQIQQNPFQGIGNPEPLKHDLKGYWSRRLNREHRIVYKVEGKGKTQIITVIQVRFHY
ncbi:MAG: Txe/YoeB family addiction module toxin [Flavobacteriaceae bacterium]|nr:Txe/YoeB family addiction module toxin [Flavobacteriaceae bacterium]